MSSLDHVDRLLAVVARLKACAATPTTDPRDLIDVAARIRKAGLEDFETRELPRFKRLREALSGAGLPLAALSICGFGTAEVRYTQLLRYFLDPQGQHGFRGAGNASASDA